MPLLRSLIWMAAKRAATDPRVRSMAVDAAQKARPHVERTAREARQAMREAPPTKDPRAFAQRLRDRLSDVTPPPPGPPKPPGPPDRTGQ
ncbi:MAG: hypothetical protein GVY28_04435 [Alphaproteobacteria bacterium]|jgi:hypothetical protein|nr:hypothetical protein [Alphaproteobacteria bacterium]